MEVAQLAAADAVLLLGEDDDRAPLGRLVGQGGHLGELGQLALGDAGRGQELRRLAVAEGDRPGLVEEEDVDVARGLDRPPRHREDVVTEDPVHAGDADRREEAADRRRDEADEEGDEDGRRQAAPRVEGERAERDRREEEDDRQPREEDVEGDLVRRLLPLGPLDELDHPVEERPAGLGRDLDDDPVGEDLRPPGDGRAVAAGLADDGGRLARDRRLVDGGDPLDDGPVARDQLLRLDDDEVALPEHGSGDVLLAAGFADEPPGRGVGLRPAKRVGLRLPAPLGDRLREVREEDGGPEPEDDLELERERPARSDPEEGERREDGADLDDEHHGVLRHAARVELPEGVDGGPRQQGAIEEPGLGVPGHRLDLRTSGPRSSGGARRPGRGRGRGRR